MGKYMSPEEMLRLGLIMTPFNPVTGAAMITAGTVDGNQTFEVHPDMLPRLLAGLDRVRDEYAQAQQLAQRLSYVQPPAYDEVTKQITKSIAQRAQGGENSLFDTAEGMIKWIDDFKAAVQQAITDTERVEEANRMA
ncbi:hypothetical protein CEP50_03920 [Actinopolyspora mortivallis]|uniref:PE domain-containing protein n=2 Tax=Actinopolyspora mortivallis TaxID=33906 RepID=A0A2T0H005_ACTMO|nr:hypothetical protein CEP50_03920 [Actinopolyspora mortivallis]